VVLVFCPNGLAPRTPSYLVTESLSKESVGYSWPEPASGVWDRRPLLRPADEAGSRDSPAGPDRARCRTGVGQYPAQPPHDGGPHSWAVAVVAALAGAGRAGDCDPFLACPRPLGCAPRPRGCPQTSGYPYTGNRPARGLPGVASGAGKPAGAGVSAGSRASVAGAVDAEVADEVAEAASP